MGRLPGEKSGCCSEVVVVEGWPLLEVRLFLGFLFKIVVKTETSLNNDQLEGGGGGGLKYKVNVIMHQTFQSVPPAP